MKTLFRFIAKLLMAVVLLGLIAFAALWIYFHPKPPASQVFINGNIVTLAEPSEAAAQVEAMLVEGNKIVALGTTERILARKRWNTKVHDLPGKTVLPGFVEAHGHFPGSGLDAAAVDLNSPPIGDLRSIEKLLERLKARNSSDSANDGQAAKNWLVGFGYDDTVLTENRHPTRTELDSISSSRPIYLIHISGHMGVANSAALAAMNIDANTPVPEGGEIVKNADGTLTGLLTENAHKPVMKRAYNFAPLTQLAIVRDAVLDYGAAGVTTVQNGLALKAHLNGMSLLSKLGLISQRLVLWPEGSLALQEANGELNLQRFSNKKTTVGAAKFIADGSIQGYTGYLKKAYYQTGDRADDYRGFASMTDAELVISMTAVHCQGNRQLAVHGNGDAAIDAILDAWETAASSCPDAERANDPRLILIHAQMASEDQLQRMQQLGVTPSFFNSHVYYWGDRHRDIFMGPERAARISPMASAEKIGLRYSIHLDTPVVPINPMLAVWNAVTRQTSGGKTLGAEQAISAEKALRATTIDAAWQMQLDDKIGSLVPGKLADLVVLSANPLKPDADLKVIKPVQTWVGGVRIFSAE